MTHASLFSGIGGFDLAAHWAGWDNAFNCEINPFCQTVLKYHFPDAKQYSDIRTTDFSVWRGMVDVLSGGFPCQPFSQAGKRKGTNDDRYLWPEMLGAIREIRPRWVVGENVLGIVNWSEGMVFQQVCADLESEGYEVQPYVLPACGVDAPHQRYRTWFVAKNTECVRRDGIESKKESEAGRFGQLGAGNNVRVCNGAKVVENTSSLGRFGQEVLCQQPRGTSIISTGPTRNPGQWEELAGVTTHSKRFRGNEVCQGIQSPQPNGERVNGNGGQRDDSHSSDIPHWINFPTQPPVRRGDDGLSDRLDFDAVFNGIPKPRQAKAYVRWRTEAIKANGNAIVPQVVLQIFKTINEYERLYGAKG